MESIKEIFRIGHGPSSSHTMGPNRAAKKFKSMYPTAKAFQVELYGSLAATGRGHLTDKVLEDTMAPLPIEILWKAEETLPKHPNGMVFKALDEKGIPIGDWSVYSTGGGAIRGHIEWDQTPAPVYPLSSMDKILAMTEKTGINLWEYVEQQEDPGIYDYLGEVWQAMQGAILRGLENEGRLPGPLNLQRKAASYRVKSINSARMVKEIGSVSAYALAVAEENAGGGEVVTAPTCGSCGVLPAVLHYLQESYDFSDQRILRALATAGLIGILVKKNASISGAEVGCQGEIGTACAMAAAAAAQLLGGTVSQIEYAAEMGIEHHLGLTCDPVQGFVQIPCIERNAAAGVKALHCASYAVFSDGGHRISFDEVVQTMKETGLDMQAAYKETSQKGLAKNWTNSDK